MLISLDRYDVSARVLPSLIVVTPLAAALYPWVPFEVDVMKVLTSGIGGLVAAYFLAQATRDAGKRIEPGLWKSWGGSPTTVMLRYSDGQFDARWKDGVRRRLRTLNPDLVLPGKDQESCSPAEADAAYERAVTWLRNKTRRPEFPLLLTENIAYGFRRNLFAIRWIAALSCLAGVASGTAAIYLAKQGLPVVIISIVVALYLSLQTKAALRRQAVTYAKSLFDTLDNWPAV